MLLFINAVICALIALRTSLFVRKGRHRYVICILAYLLTVAAGCEVILTLYGKISEPSICELYLKAMLCIAIFKARGNIAHLLQPICFSASAKAYPLKH